MMIKNQEFFQAIQAFHCIALKNIECLNNLMPQITLPKDYWEMNSDTGQLSRFTKQVKMYAKGIGEITAPLSQSNELIALKNIIKSTPEIVRHLNTPVGSALSRITISINDLCCYTVYQALKLNQFEFDQILFEKIYLNFENSIYLNQLNITRTVALKGIKIPFAEIQLTPDTKLRKLHQNEIVDWMNKNLELSYDDKVHEWGMTNTYSDIIIQRSTSSVKHFGEIEDYSKTVAAVDDFYSYEPELLFIAVCKIFIHGYVYLSNSIYELEQDLFTFGRTIYGSTRLNSFASAYQSLDEIEASELISLWLSVWKIRKDRSFLIRAIQRLSASTERDSAEDRMIDLAIAGESLFLSGDGNNTELRFRLSLRAASYLGNSREERLQIYKSFLKFYDLRSAVVHGTIDLLPNSTKLTEATELMNLVSDYIRSTLKKCIRASDKVKKPKQLVDDWESLLFIDIE